MNKSCMGQHKNSPVENPNPKTPDADHPAEEARTVKVTLIGRPGKVETRSQAIMFRLQRKPLASIPRGLPPLPNTPALT